jgi:hypothetical protein
MNVIEKFVSRNGKRIAVDVINPPVRRHKSSEKDYLHADMKDLVVGCNVASIVWLRLVQLKTMQKKRTVTLSNDWFQQHGINRWAKNRALRALEKSGLIQVTRSDHRSPRVTLVRQKDAGQTILKAA